MSENEGKKTKDHGSRGVQGGKGENIVSSEGAIILDGAALAQKIRNEIKKEVSLSKKGPGLQLCL